MKKVLALVLAVMMLCTMAFATSNPNPNPKKPVTDEENNVNFGGSVGPGDELYVYWNMPSNIPGTDASANNNSNAWNAEITSSNYTITSQKWTKNKDLLAGLEFDDDKNQLVIKIKEDFSLKQPKYLTGSFTLKGKGKGGIGDKKPVNIKVTLNVKVGNELAAMYLNKEEDRTISADLVKDNTVYKFRAINTDNNQNADDVINQNNGMAIAFMDSGAGKIATDDYGTVVLETKDEDVEVNFRGYKGEELFLFNKTAANSALLKQYADKDADITFLTFVANPTLTSTATIRFYKDEESHVYVLKDGKISSEVKWDDDESCFLLKARSLGSYVFSDKALPIGTTAADNNPDTGANDVVGIATALAAVALVSAAAVSLKK